MIYLRNRVKNYKFVYLLWFVILTMCIGQVQAAKKLLTTCWFTDKDGSLINGESLKFAFSELRSGKNTKLAYDNLNSNLPLIIEKGHTTSPILKIYERDEQIIAGNIYAVGLLAFKVGGGYLEFSNKSLEGKVTTQLAKEGYAWKAYISYVPDGAIEKKRYTRDASCTTIIIDKIPEQKDESVPGLEKLTGSMLKAMFHDYPEALLKLPTCISPEDGSDSICSNSSSSPYEELD
ncbi:MAG: hypothetical protein K0R14_1684 [Burkholderiales bacterium]|jgi:hypothetical protein|nr:hypothetical protein [Burkholderiales bacterium]